MSVAIQTGAQVLFEKKPCLICGNVSPVPKYSFADSYGHYHLAVCPSCGFLFLNPRPSQDTIGVYYAAENYTPFLSSSENDTLFSKLYRRVRRYSVAWKRRRIERLLPKGAILDLGCGTGEFLLEMQQHGWTAAGIEPSVDASAFARESLRLDVSTGTVDSEAVSRISKKFNVITMWHVLEHVHEADKALENIYDVLENNGLLLIAVPNIASFDAAVYGQHWIALDPPRHLYHFTPDTMSRLLHKAGFTIVAKKQIPLDTIFNCLMSEMEIVRQRWLFLAPFFLMRSVLVTLISLLIGITGKRSSTVLFFVRKNV